MATEKINYKGLEGTVVDGVYVHKYFRVAKVSEAGKKYSVGYLTVSLEEYLQNTLDITLSRWKKWNFIDELKELAGEVTLKIDNDLCIEYLECSFNETLYTLDGTLVTEKDFFEKHFRNNEPFDGEQYVLKDEDGQITFKQGCLDEGVMYGEDFMDCARAYFHEGGMEYIFEDWIEPTFEDVEGLCDFLEDDVLFAMEHEEDDQEYVQELIDSAIADIDEYVQQLDETVAELQQYNFAA